MRTRFCLATRWSLACVVLFSAPIPALPQTNAAQQLSGALKVIADCAAKNQDAILLPEKVECRDQYQLRGRPPRDAAVSVDCHGQSDHRWLPGDAIKRIAAEARASTRGIRIYGAVFCRDELDLSGLELSYSLVLARSYHRFGIRGENFRTHGDLVVDDSLILQNLTLTGAHIDGSLFGQHSFIQELNVADSEIHGSIILIDSLLYKSVQFDRIKLSGDLSIRNAALSFFVAHNATIAGVLDLTESEARCAYHIKKSQIGAVIAVNAGFGTLIEPDGDNSVPTEFSWRRSNGRPTVSRWSANSAVRELIGTSESCGTGYSVISSSSKYQAEFFLFDNQVRTSICLKSLQWLDLSDRWLALNEKWRQQGATWRAQHPENTLPVTILAMNGTVAAKNLILALWPPAQRGAKDDLRRPFRKLEVIGVEAKDFVYDFGDLGRPYFTFVDGLNIERVYSADISCDYKPEVPPQQLEDIRQRTTINELASEVRLPRVTEALNWLERNAAHTTQPFVALSKAFDNVGADSTDLKVARAAVEWKNERDRFAAAWHRQTAKDPVDRFYSFLWEEGGHGFLDSLRFGAKWLLGLIADYGYRPAKVGWSVVITIVLFWVIFHWVLKIVAFKPKDKNEARKLGLMFLFDRLIPGYQIRDDNYEIEEFLKPATPGAANTVTYANQPTQQYVRATDAEARRAKSWIDLLRVIGIVLAVFLVAAVNQLVAQ